mgnify:CR=1 FL=1
MSDAADLTSGAEPSGAERVSAAASDHSSKPTVKPTDMLPSDKTASKRQPMEVNK